MNEAQELELRGICFSMAKLFKWQLKPIDSEEIENIANQVFSFAKVVEELVDGYGYDAEFIISLFSYAEQTVDGPFFGNDDIAMQWLRNKIEILLELSVYKPEITGKGALFVNSLRCNNA